MKLSLLRHAKAAGNVYFYELLIFAHFTLLYFRHPDKSNHPDAEQKFIEIKKAYELLNDADRRRIYDQHGITNEDSHYFKQQKHDYSSYGRFNYDPFEEFFGKNFFFDQDISLYHKLSITTKYFEQTIMKKSKTIPHIIMFYNDWCFRCTRLVPAFKKLIETLEPLGLSAYLTHCICLYILILFVLCLGIQFATVNGGHEPQVLRKASVKELPTLILVLNGHSYIYRNTLYTPPKVVGKYFLIFMTFVCCGVRSEALVSPTSVRWGLKRTAVDYLN